MFYNYFREPLGEQEGASPVKATESEIISKLDLYRFEQQQEPPKDSSVKQVMLG